MATSVYDAVQNMMAHKDAVRSLKEDHAIEMGDLEQRLSVIERLATHQRNEHPVPVVESEVLVPLDYKPPQAIKQKRKFADGDRLTYTWGGEAAWTYGKKTTSYAPNQSSSSWYTRVIGSARRVGSAVSNLAEWYAERSAMSGRAADHYFELPFMGIHGEVASNAVVRHKLFPCCWNPFDDDRRDEPVELGRVVEQSAIRHNPGGDLDEEWGLAPVAQVIAPEDIGQDDDYWTIKRDGLSVSDYRKDRGLMGLDEQLDWAGEDPLKTVQVGAIKASMPADYTSMTMAEFRDGEQSELAPYFGGGRNYKPRNLTDYVHDPTRKTLEFVVFNKGRPSSLDLIAEDTHFTEALDVNFMKHIIITESDERWVGQTNVDVKVQAVLAVADVERWTGGGLILGFIEPKRDVRRTRMVVDRALLVELMSPSIIGVSEDLAIKAQRIRQASANLRSVNSHKDFDMVSDYWANTVELAVSLMFAKHHGNPMVSEKISQSF